MDYESILFEVADGVATVTFNRPDRRNCLNGRMLADIRDALSRAGAGNDLDAQLDLEREPPSASPPAPTTSATAWPRSWRSGRPGSAGTERGG